MLNTCIFAPFVYGCFVKFCDKVLRILSDRESWLLTSNCILPFMSVFFFVCVLISLPHGTMGWSVIVTFPGLTNLLVSIFYSHFLINTILRFGNTTILSRQPTKMVLIRLHRYFFFKKSPFFPLFIYFIIFFSIFSISFYCIILVHIQCKQIFSSLLIC